MKQNCLEFLQSRSTLALNPKRLERVGSLFRPANLQAWCEALKHCYANREELGLRAKEHAKVIDHRRSIAMFRSVIRDALRL